MKNTAIAAAILMVGLLGTSGNVASAAPLAHTQTNVVHNLLLASSDGTKNTTQKDTNDSAGDSSQPAPQPAAPAPAAPAPVIVTVQPGDNLSTIATANNSTWQRIYDVNLGITDPNIINPGEQLRIPAPDEQVTDRALPQVVAPAAPVAAPTAAAVPAPVTPAPVVRAAPVSAPVAYPVSPNAAKAYIYAHESGNNPNATNPNGCYGLGQDCNGRVRALCGADYACQDAFFTNYAMSRYGSWANALAFWQAHHWW